LWKETDDYQLKIRCPPKGVGCEVGRLTCFTFVKGTSQLLVGTNRGAVIVYGYTLEYHNQVADNNYEHLKFIKVLKIEKEKINVIKNVDG
jgi:hypothetical protein